MRREHIVVAFYGYPGSGKGTQANLVANAFGLANFDTGRMLEMIWYDPSRQAEPLVMKEKAIFEKGELNTPSFVLGEVERMTKTLSDQGAGIVYSGSPRTMFEAEGLIPTLETLYGKDRVFFFHLDVDPSDSLARNGKRLLCKECKTPVLMQYYPTETPKYCPLCAGELYRRTLDDPKTIPNRLKEYEERTWPIIDFLKARGHDVPKIDGRPAPHMVFKEVARLIDARLHSGA